MGEDKLTSTEVVYALVQAKAVGTLTVTGDQGTVTITGSQDERARAREILTRQGWTCTTYPGRDEWSC